MLSMNGYDFRLRRCNKHLLPLAIERVNVSFSLKRTTSIANVRGDKKNAVCTMSLSENPSTSAGLVPVSKVR